MMQMRVLKWTSESFGDKYYDIRTNEMLNAAALSILQTRMELEFFSPPSPPERDRSYQRNKKRRDTLLIALSGNSDAEAFEEMRSELLNINKHIERIEKRHTQRQQEYNKIRQILDNQDGEKAINVIAGRTHLEEENIEIIIPQNCGELEIEDENSEEPATIQ